MEATKAERDVRRATRWLRTSGEIDSLTADAFALLVERLAARMRALRQAAPLIVAAVVLSFWAFMQADRWGSGDHQDRFAVYEMPTFACVVFALLLADGLTRRGERRIGATLPRRVGRPTAVPLRTVLGPVRTLFLGYAVVAEAAVAVALIALTSGWFRWAFLGAFAFTGASAAIGIRRALRRPTIAFDQASLAIDERLRSDDAFHAAFPLYFLSSTALVAANSGNGLGWHFVLLTFVGLSVLFFWMFANSCRPWRPLRKSFFATLDPWTRSPSSPTDNPYARR